MNPLETFRKFVNAINDHNVKEIRTLMTDDHLFADSLGHTIQGDAVMEQGWKGYFSMCPDYSIRINDLAAQSDIVLAAGEAGGTIDGQPWCTPAAWKAVIRDQKIAEWRVFADNKPVYDILAKRQNANPT
jgi:ketosteroid isomerase-like protein